MSTPTPQESSALSPAQALDSDKRITIIEALEAPSKRLESMAELRAENRALVKLIRRLHSAIVARMSASEPTIEERLELRHAWEQAGKVLDNAATLPVTPNAAVCGPKVALDEAIARMEAVPVEELDALWNGILEKARPDTLRESLFSGFRARLIAAARGQV